MGRPVNASTIKMAHGKATTRTITQDNSDDCQVPVLMRMLAKRLKGYRALGYVTDNQLELL